MSTKLYCNFDMSDWMNWSSNNLLSKTTDIINDSRKIYNFIAGLSGKDICYENIIDKLQDETTRMNIFYSVVSFLQYVSPNDDIRNASMKCDVLLNNYFIELWNRKDVYKIINIFYKKIDKSDKFKNQFAEDYKYIQRIIRDFKRNGMELDDYNKDKLQNISEKISELEIKFTKNLNDVDTVLLFTKEQLDGLSEDFLSNLPTTIADKNQTIKKLNLTLSEQENIEISKQLGLNTENNFIDENKVLKYEISMKYPIYKSCMRSVTVEATRKMLSHEFDRRCIEENFPIILKLIELRNKRAKMVGYSDHLNYTTELLVSGNGEKVKNFLEDMIIKTTKSCKKDLNILKLIKGSDINPWDVAFYKEQIKKQNYNIDSNKLKEFFELKNTINKTLNIYQNLFGLKFVKNDDKIVWHNDVITYDVFNINKCKNECINECKNECMNECKNGYIGTFYMDLHPRPHKYNHAACFPLQPSCSLSNKNKIYPVSAIVTNFTKSNNDKPSLLSFDEVVTFFHEFGHIVHQLLGRSKFSLFSGSSTETDFVEAPSQMLENWCWEKESIKYLSKHYETNEQLDDTTIDNLINIKNLLSGFSIRKQIYLSEFDVIVHSDQKLINTLNDTEEAIKSKILYYITKKLHKNMIGIPIQKNTFSFASFGHFSGYDAQYYSYLWSGVYAADMFYEKFKNNLFNPKIGLEYRKKILEKGGTIDGAIMIKNFLGREPSINNYLISKGLQNNDDNCIKNKNNDCFKIFNIDVNKIVNKPSYEDYIQTSDESQNTQINEDVGLDLLDDYN